MRQLHGLADLRPLRCLHVVPLGRRRSSLRRPSALCQPRGTTLPHRRPDHRPRVRQVPARPMPVSEPGPGGGAVLEERPGDADDHRQHVLQEPAAPQGAAQGGPAAGLLPVHRPVCEVDGG